MRDTERATLRVLETSDLLTKQSSRQTFDAVAESERDDTGYAVKYCTIERDDG